MSGSIDDDVKEMWNDGWISKLLLTIWFGSMALWLFFVGWLVCIAVRYVA